MSIVYDQIDADVGFEEIGISIFKKFPNTSLYLKNFFILSGIRYNSMEFIDASRDTLMKLDYVFLKFNLFDLVRKNYKINSFEVNSGYLNILIDSEGGSNYILAQQFEENDSTLFIDIKGFTAKNLIVNYTNRAKQTNSHLLIRKTDLEGNFSKNFYNMRASGEAYIYDFFNRDVKYISNTDITTDLSLIADHHKLSVSKGEISVGDVSADILGSITFEKTAHAVLDLTFEGKNLELAWLTNLLRLNEKKDSGIEGKGLININGRISGVASLTQSPDIYAIFRMKNGTLAMKQLPVDAKSISLKGTFSNGVTNSIVSSSIVLDHFEMTLKKSRIYGKGEIKNLIDPAFKLDLSGEIYAAEWNELLTDYSIEINDGKIMPLLKISGNASGLADNNIKIKITPTGDIEFFDLDVSYEISRLQLDSISGTIQIGKRAWRTSFTGRLYDSDFLAELSVSDPLAFLKNKDHLLVEGFLHSKDINFDRMKSNFNEYHGNFNKYPENIELNLELLIDYLVNNNIALNNFSGNIRYNYPEITFDVFNLQTMNGRMAGNIHIFDLDKYIYQSHVKAAFTEVDIHQLFVSLNNLGQDFITSENLEGRISGDAELMVPLTKEFKFDLNNIYSESNFLIENGELINFQPLTKTYNFLKIDNLDHIRFSELRNNVLINDGKIYIPQMEINSSAFDMKASGIHGFDNTYEYHLSMKLSEFMYNKSMARTNPEFKIAADPEDKRTVFLVLYDQGKGMQIEFDQERALNKIRQDLRNERNELKSILKKEFGSNTGKQDTITEPAEYKEPVLEFVFPDDDSRDTVATPKEKKKRWWKKNNPDNNVPEIQFIIDNH